LASNAQGLEVIIIVVHVGAVEIYVATVGALRKKERQDETQFTTKIDGFLNSSSPSSPPLLNANVCFLAGFLLILHLYDQTQGSGAMFSLLYG
jgi:hypothetical protein